jgi:23S rRNA (uracil1939-C5)-methyltransferase
MQTFIESLTHLGMGRTVEGELIPRVLPGETIDLTEGGVRIVTPSVDRISAVCRHYKGCGGCSMQHASQAFTATWKQNIVERALAAHGISPDFRPIHVSPPNSRRRAKFSGTRTKKGALVGLHGRASDVIVAIPDCQLISSDLINLIPVFEQLTVLAASRKSEIDLTVTASDAGADVHIETAQPLTEKLRVELAELVQSQGLARLTWNDEPVVERVPPYQTFGKVRVVPPAGAFLQATRDGEEALFSSVLDTVSGSKRVVDLFAGCGTFALRLADQSEVHAVEGEASMMAALDKGWRMAAGLKRVTTETRDLFRRPLEPDELDKFDAAVIDPPRAGAASQMATLARSKIGKIAMVSCNPVTFARDVAVLTAAGYKVDWVQVVDQFRWSAHVEIAASLTRK